MDYVILAELLLVINIAVTKNLKIKPYRIQNLAVIQFFLNPNNERGRIAQIATGEGKSLIIAMVALVSSL